MKPRQLRKINCTKCWCTFLIIDTLLVIGAIIMLSISLQRVSWSYGVRTYKKSEQLGSTPFQHHLDGNGGVIEVTLPNDLTAYIGITYTVAAFTAAPHKIRIENGPLSTSWNAMNHKLATLGGDKGDFLVFYVVDKDTIAIIEPQDTVFS